MLQRDSAHSQSHRLDCSPLRGVELHKQFGPLDYNHSLPQLRRHGVGQVVALANWEIPKPTLGLLGLADICEPSSMQIDAIDNRPTDRRCLIAGP
jgi:hypothetical protein